MAHHCKAKTGHEADDNELAVFQATPPSRTHCCQCKHTLTYEQVQEMRPTGLGGAVQDWHFCPACYSFYNELCNCPTDAGDLAAFCRKLLEVHCSVKVPTIRVR